MSLLTLLIFLSVMGVVVYCINAYIPMPPIFKTIILTLAVCVAIYYVLSVTGILGSFSHIRVPTTEK